MAISNGRLRALDLNARTVTFTYKDYADGHQHKTLILTGVEFLRRFRLHVLPQGFTKIRHYGLLGNNRRHRRVPLARAALEQSPLRFQPKLAAGPPPQPRLRSAAPTARAPTFAVSPVSMPPANGPSSPAPPSHRPSQVPR